MGGWENSTQAIFLVVLFYLVAEWHCLTDFSSCQLQLIWFCYAPMPNTKLVRSKFERTKRYIFFNLITLKAIKYHNILYYNFEMQWKQFLTFISRSIKCNFSLLITKRWSFLTNKISLSIKWIAAKKWKKYTYW